jgi:hypothetical protein
VLATACLAAAQTADKTDKPADKAKAKPAVAGVTMAVLDYEASIPGNEQLGTQIADILTARLSVEESLEMVERAKLSAVVQEQKLKMVGLVDQDAAAKVGKLVGAKLLVMGKAFLMDKKLVIVTKVVGVETSRVVGSILQVDMNKELSSSILQLSEDVAALVRKESAKLLPKEDVLPDPVDDIRKALKDLPKPSVAVVVPETHITRVVVDPAVETEIKKVLIDCGFKMVDRGQNDLAKWAKEMLKDAKGDKAWPAALDKADVVIVGEAFSEFAVRTGELVTCTARAEVNLIDRHNGTIILADRETRRAVDLSEVLAGKTALQSAGRRLGISIAQKLLEYAKTMPKEAPAPTPKSTEKTGDGKTDAGKTEADKPAAGAANDGEKAAGKPAALSSPLGATVLAMLAGALPGDAASQPASAPSARAGRRAVFAAPF